MKALIFALLLLPTLASAKSFELECDDAKVSFLARWIRSSVVRVEGQVNWEFPWTGRESVVSGDQLRSERVQDLVDTSLAADEDELLRTVPAETKFVVFQKRGSGQTPLANLLYVDKSLLEGREADGLVIAVRQHRLDITTSRIDTGVKVHHCRSR